MNVSYTLKALGLFVLIVTFLGVIVWGTIRGKTVDCERKAEGLELPGRWKIIGGCQVLIDGRWVPIQNVRVGL